MTPTTTLLDRVRLRLRSRADLEQAVQVAETDRDIARAQATGWQRAAVDRVDVLQRIDDALREHDHITTTDLADDVARALRVECARGERLLRQSEEFEAQADRLVHQSELFEADLIAVDEALAKAGATVETVPGGRTAAIDWLTAHGGELEAIRDELRATGHQVGDARGVSYDVDIAIDRERSRAQDLVERLADVLGWPTHPIWPMSAPHIIRELAVRLGKSIPARAVRWSDWGPGSRTARALACTCRGERGRGPSSIVDPRCPEHSPGHRFGGRPVQPLALPPSPTSRYGFDALDVWDGSVAPGGWVCDVCRFPVESEPCREHQPKAYADMLADAEGVPF